LVLKCPRLETRFQTLGCKNGKKFKQIYLTCTCLEPALEPVQWFLLQFALQLQMHLMMIKYFPNKCICLLLLDKSRRDLFPSTAAQVHILNTEVEVFFIQVLTLTR